MLSMVGMGTLADQFLGVGLRPRRPSSFVHGRKTIDQPEHEICAVGNRLPRVQLALSCDRIYATESFRKECCWERTSRRLPAFHRVLNFQLLP